MGKYTCGVPWPSKTIRLTHPKAKLTSRQHKFGTRIASVAGKALNVKNKGLTYGKR